MCTGIRVYMYTCLYVYMHTCTYVVACIDTHMYVCELYYGQEEILIIYVSDDSPPKITGFPNNIGM